MIKIIQVATRSGRTVLRIQADFPDQTVRAVEIDYAEVENKLKQVQEILGREPTDRDFIDAIKAIVNEMRLTKRPLEKKLPFEKYINVDLEAE